MDDVAVNGTRNGRLSPGEWLCVGGFCQPLGRLLRGTVSSAYGVVRVAAPERAHVNRWVRYTIGLQHTPAPAPDVELMPVTDEIVASLREHPDAGAAQLRSGLRFWDHGLRRAFIWRTDGAPACIQWLLFKQDIGLLHSLREWGGMYAPLPDGWGQVENLFAFSTARRKGVATQFEYALYARARELGLTALVTHIHEDNVAARGWADRTGWREYGVITRYHIDVPGLRGLNACVHTNGGARGPGAARPMPVGAPST